MHTKTRWLAYIILLMSLAGVFIGSGLAALNRTEYANGWDAYHYLIQVQSLNNTGAMHSTEYSPVYLPILAWHTVTEDYIATYKLTAVMIKLLFVFSVFTLGFSLLNSQSDVDRRTAFFTALYHGRERSRLSITGPTARHGVAVNVARAFYRKHQTKRNLLR